MGRTTYLLYPWGVHLGGWGIHWGVVVVFFALHVDHFNILHDLCGDVAFSGSPSGQTPEWGPGAAPSTALVSQYEMKHIIIC